MYRNRKYIGYISSEFSIAAQNIKQVGVTLRRFVARFGRRKVRALGLLSSGVKEREANRSDVEKERLDTRRGRSGAVRRSQLLSRLLQQTLHANHPLFQFADITDPLLSTATSFSRFCSI